MIEMRCHMTFFHVITLASASHDANDVMNGNIEFMSSRQSK